MREGKGAIVIPAHAGQRGRIIIGGLFRRVLLAAHRQQRLRDQRAADADSDTVQEIAPRNRAVHAQVPVSFLIAHRVEFPRARNNRHAL